MDWPQILLVFILIIVGLVGFVVLLDVLMYMDLQRRLRKERERRRNNGRDKGR